jgi:hypothetical protein
LAGIILCASAFVFGVVILAAGGQEAAHGKPRPGILACRLMERRGR